jgi:hypothetical protein
MPLRINGAVMSFNARRGRAQDPRCALQIDVNRGQRSIAAHVRIRKVLGQVRQHHDPERPVKDDPAGAVGGDEAHREHHRGNGKGQHAQECKEPAEADDLPFRHEGSDQRQERGRAGSRNGRYEAVANRRDAVDVVDQHILVVRERHVAERQGAVGFVVQRPEDQDRIGKNEADENDEARDAGGDPFPGTQLGALQSTGLATNRSEASASDQDPLQPQ